MAGLTIAVIHLTKGGAGKTTLATNIAVELSRRVLAEPYLIDFDEDQRASEAFIAKRIKEDIHLLADPTFKQIDDLITQQETVVFDTGGYDSSNTQALIATADIVLIPVLNNDIERNALIKLSAKLHQIGKITNKTINYLIVPTRIHTSVNKHIAMNYFKELEPMGYKITEPIYYRLAYQKCFNTGLGVVEGKDKKAKAEIVELVNIVLKGIK